MTARFKPRNNLDVEIAERLVQPVLRNVVDMLTDEAKGRAPAVKVWVTQRDEKVRPTHFKADAQTIPANLRFKIEKVNGTGTELGRAPRDDALSPANRYNCRCAAPSLPQPLRDSIHSNDIRVDGTLVHGSVETRFPRAAESEFGTSEDDAAAFMRGALDAVALRLRSGHSR